MRLLEFRIDSGKHRGQLRWYIHNNVDRLVDMDLVMEGMLYLHKDLTLHRWCEFENMHDSFEEAKATLDAYYGFSYGIFIEADEMRI